MGSEPSPAFQFYVKDWRSSLRVQAMSFAAQGMYLAMLCEQWETGAAPSSPAACAERMGGTTAEWSRAWKKVSACFVVRKRDGLLVNPRLEAERRKRRNYQKAQAESGLRGARARWKQHGKPIGSPSSRHSDPNASPMAKNGSSSSSSSSFAFASSGGGTPPPPGRRKRPIFTGQRLVVFAWQAEDLKRMLGPLTDQFDLDAWFTTLDARMVSDACVMPPRDGGAWLQAQTLAEAQRRALPIALPPAAVAGKQTTRLMNGLANIRREAMR